MVRALPPSELQTKFALQESGLIVAITLNRPEYAESICNTQLSELSLHQGEERLEDANYTVHKGMAYHNKGIALTFQDRNTEGFIHILAAYLEDIFTYETIEQAQSCPAYRFLSQSGQDEIISRWTDIAVEMKSSNHIPEDTISMITGEDSDYNIRPISELINERLPGTRETRVFIGGDYSFMADLREIRNIVRELNFEPIIVADYENLDDLFPMPRTKSISILQQCSRAIFDVSSPGGQYMEIEFIIGRPHLNIQMKVYTQSTHNVSSMLNQCQPEMFTSHDELREKIVEWLQT